MNLRNAYNIEDIRRYSSTLYAVRLATKIRKMEMLTLVSAYGKQGKLLFYNSWKRLNSHSRLLRWLYWELQPHYRLLIKTSTKHKKNVYIQKVECTYTREMKLNLLKDIFCTLPSRSKSINRLLERLRFLASRAPLTVLNKVRRKTIVSNARSP